MKPESNRRTLSRKANWSERARYYLVREIARSCNITNFYPQGTVKAIVYRTRVDWRQELIERIDGAFVDLKQDKHEIRRATNSISVRCEAYKLEKGDGILKWTHKSTFFSV